MIKKIKHFFQKNSLLIFSVLFLVFFAGSMQLFAADPPPLAGGYPAGTVLDPGCAPGSANCFVTPFSQTPWTSNIYSAGFTLYGGTLATSNLTLSSTDNIIKGKIMFGAFSAYDEANTRLGIGTIAPGVALDVAGSTNIVGGNLDLDNTTNANQYGVITKNGVPFIHDFNYGVNGNSITTIGRNLFIGTNAGNFTMGATATLSSEASYNTAVGYGSMVANTTGLSNTALGYYSLYANTGGQGNTAIGNMALVNNLGNSGTGEGMYNTAVGYLALFANTTGAYNNAFGEDSLIANVSGIANSAFGNWTLHVNVFGSDNVAMGQKALEFSTGNGNTSLGVESLAGITTGNNNTALGIRAGLFETGGIINNNTADDSLYLGANTKALISGGTNEIVIGANAIGNGSNTVTLGHTNIVETILRGNVGIGTEAPSNVLDVVGAPLDTTVVSISTTGGNTCSFNTTLGTFACASDERLKYDINSIEGNDALSKLALLNPVTYHYNWQDSDEDLVPGFIAQEMEEVFPSMVSTNSKTSYKSLSYVSLVPYTIKAIQELDLKVEDLIVEKQNLFSNLISWFGNVENGIGDFFANRIKTKEICISDESGETCITKSQLDQILSAAGTTSSGSSIVTESVPEPEIPTCEELGNCPVSEPESDLENSDVVVDEENSGAPVEVPTDVVISVTE